MIYCGQLLRADNFSQILERKTKQEDDSILLHRKLMTRIWTWKQILDSLSFGNCCFCASFYTVRQFEKKRKIENLVDCPKKRKPVRASREKVLTEKIFWQTFYISELNFKFENVRKENKKFIFWQIRSFWKTVGMLTVWKFPLEFGLNRKFGRNWQKKIKKNKKEKRIFVKLRQFSTAYQLTENVVSRIRSLYHEIKTFGNEQAPRS